MSTSAVKESRSTCKTRQFAVSGTAAHSRIVKFLPEDWQDATNRTSSLQGSLDFLWENRPRRETKSLRDYVACYSHLPNGIALLDDKGYVARLLSLAHASTEPTLALLPTLVFSLDELQMNFQSLLDMIRVTSGLAVSRNSCSCCGLDDPSGTESLCPICEYFTRHVWVIKDVGSNGASGIWFFDSKNMQTVPFLNNPRLSQSIQRRFVAQRYAWPLLLFQGRKFHVRVYVILTCHGQVFIHKRAFLHVANQCFQVDQGIVDELQSFEPSMHITNCCANSHDEQLFMGEICADLTQYSDHSSHSQTTSLFSPFYDTSQYHNSHISPETVVPLGEFMPSIVASIKTLTQNSFSFLQGGEANHGFEYLGLDFILSYRPNTLSSSTSNHFSFQKQQYIPLAYLLEVNAPPSQDTATGLPHAEALHDQVLKDWVDYWVIPHVMGSFSMTANAGGWIHVYTYSWEIQRNHHEKLLPSKAAWVNKVRWILYENKLIREAKTHGQGAEKLMSEQNIMTHFRRKTFPFFSNDGVTTVNMKPWVYLENAG
jgi:hypothetical protein